MKLKQYEDEKLYRRGIDYPAYSKNNIKMSMVMYGKDIKRWFKDDEEILEEYPDKDGYAGSLP